VNRVRSAVVRAARAAVDRLPPERREPARRRLRRLARPAFLGTLRRTEPLSRRWGYDRGQPVDRYYIDDFLREHRADIRGRVLEVKESLYTDRYGHELTERAVLDVDPLNGQATIVADLAAPGSIAADGFDCFVLTQTLHLIPDVRAAVKQAHRVLRPGGVLLATVPSLSRALPSGGDYWRFTPAACRHLFEPAFGADRVDVRGYGNVLAAIAFLAGMASEELKPRELDALDPEFPVLVAIRAVKGP
jgi:SAM-dependent methyltransferase